MAAAGIARTVATLAICLTPCGAESRVGFLGHQADDINDNVVSVQDLELSLQGSLNAALSNRGGIASERLAAIEASTWRTFQALPKNSFGRLDPRGVRHIVHSYFAKEHGWLINGLEPHGMTANVTEVHDVNILKDKAPALVESLLESRQVGRGLSLGDVLAMIGALEQLIFDESLTLLQSAYKLNGHSVEEHLDESALHEVLQSYLLLFGQGHKADIEDVRKHQDLKAAFSSPDLTDFQDDTVRNFDFARRSQINPFKPRAHSFSDVSRIVTELAQTYGKFQNAECSAMKESLMELDLDGSGRVPLSTFHAQPDGAVYQFSESLTYLRQIGALDETVTGNPRVMIANYVAGPSNCIASSSYYSVCCLNECEGILNELEGLVQAPTASPQQLLSLVGNLASATVDAPRQLPHTLVEKLYSIADLNGGTVPLQGRLFAQWLHYAFPNECPYPSIVESSIALTPNQWSGGKSAASPEERQRAGSVAEAAADGADVAGPAVSLAQWSDDEVLPLYEPSVSIEPVVYGALRSMLRLAALLGVLYFAVQAVQGVLATGQTALSAQGFAGDKKKQSQHCSHLDHVSSLYV